MILILIEILVAALLVLISYFKWTYQYWKRKNVPYLEPSMPFGNFQPPHKQTLQTGLEVQEFYKRAKANGWKYCGIFAIDNPIFLVCDLELCKLILAKDFQYFSNRGHYYNAKSDPVSHHLFAMDGNHWKTTRTKLSPSFSSGKLKSMFFTLTACRDILLQQFEKEVAKGDAIDTKAVLNKFGIDVIGSCAFGLECNSFEDPNSPFVLYGTKALNGDIWRVIRDFLEGSYPNFAKFLGLGVFEKDINDFFLKVVSDTINYRRKNNVTRADFLQALMELMYNEQEYKKLADGEPFTMEESVAQCFIFFIAGYETTTTTMSFALYELARNPDVQDKVRKEISDILKGNDLSYDSLADLKYMQKVIDETLRLYPPLPVTTRQCIQDWKIPDTDTYVEKGTKIFIPIRAFHYDPDYYEEPEKFKPERFNKSGNIHPYAHIPFGEGPRICIGQRFGIMEAKVGLTAILQRYRVTVNKNTKEPIEFHKEGLIIQAKDTVWLDFERIK